jgi:hypothetical protein
VCRNYSRTGSCRWGDTCRHIHEVIMCCRRHLPIEMESAPAQFMCVRSPGRTFLRFELPIWCLGSFALWRSGGFESLWRCFFLSFRRRGCSFLPVRRCCGFSLWRRPALLPLRRPATAATPERLQRSGPPVCQVLLRGLLFRQKKRASSFVGTPRRSTSSSSTSASSYFTTACVPCVSYRGMIAA